MKVRTDRRAASRPPSVTIGPVAIRRQTHRAVLAVCPGCVHTKEVCSVSIQVQNRSGRRPASRQLANRPITGNDPARLKVIRPMTADRTRRSDAIVDYPTMKANFRVGRAGHITHIANIVAIDRVVAEAAQKMKVIEAADNAAHRITQIIRIDRTKSPAMAPLSWSTPATNGWRRNANKADRMVSCTRRLSLRVARQRKRAHLAVPIHIIGGSIVNISRRLMGGQKCGRMSWRDIYSLVWSIRRV